MRERGPGHPPAGGLVPPPAMVRPEAPGPAAWAWDGPARGVGQAEAQAAYERGWSRVRASGEAEGPGALGAAVQNFEDGYKEGYWATLAGTERAIAAIVGRGDAYRRNTAGMASALSQLKRANLLLESGIADTSHLPIHLWEQHYSPPKPREAAGPAPGGAAGPPPEPAAAGPPERGAALEDFARRIVTSPVQNGGSPSSSEGRRGGEGGPAASAGPGLGIARAESTFIWPQAPRSVGAPDPSQATEDAFLDSVSPEPAAGRAPAAARAPGAGRPDLTVEEYMRMSPQLAGSYKRLNDLKLRWEGDAPAGGRGRYQEALPPRMHYVGPPLSPPLPSLDPLPPLSPLGLLVPRGAAKPAGRSAEMQTRSETRETGSQISPDERAKGGSQQERGGPPEISAALSRGILRSLSKPADSRSDAAAVAEPAVADAAASTSAAAPPPSAGAAEPGVVPARATDAAVNAAVGEDAGLSTSSDGRAEASAGFDQDAGESAHSGPHNEVQGPPGGLRDVSPPTSAGHAGTHAAGDGAKGKRKSKRRRKLRKGKYQRPEGLPVIAEGSDDDDLIGLEGAEALFGQPSSDDPGGGPGGGREALPSRALAAEAGDAAVQATPPNAGARVTEEGADPFSPELASKGPSRAAGTPARSMGVPRPQPPPLSPAVMAAIMTQAGLSSAEAEAIAPSVARAGAAPNGGLRATAAAAVSVGTGVGTAASGGTQSAAAFPAPHLATGSVETTPLGLGEEAWGEMLAAEAHMIPLPSFGGGDDGDISRDPPGPAQAVEGRRATESPLPGPPLTTTAVPTSPLGSQGGPASHAPVSGVASGGSPPNVPRAARLGGAGDLGTDAARPGPHYLRLNSGLVLTTALVGSGPAVDPGEIEDRFLEMALPPESTARPAQWPAARTASRGTGVATGRVFSTAVRPPQDPVAPFLRESSLFLEVDRDEAATETTAETTSAGYPPAGSPSPAAEGSGGRTGAPPAVAAFFQEEAPRPSAPPTATPGPRASPPPPHASFPPERPGHAAPGLVADLLADARGAAGPHHPPPSRGAILESLHGPLWSFGPVVAQRIVATFGERTLEVLNSPEAAARLAKVRGLRKEVADRVKAEWDRSAGAPAGLGREGAGPPAERGGVPGVAGLPADASTPRGRSESSPKPREAGTPAPTARRAGHPRAQRAGLEESPTRVDYDHAGEWPGVWPGPRPRRPVALEESPTRVDFDLPGEPKRDHESQTAAPIATDAGTFTTWESESRDVSVDSMTAMDFDGILESITRTLYPDDAGARYSPSPFLGSPARRTAGGGPSRGWLEEDLRPAWRPPGVSPPPGNW